MSLILIVSIVIRLVALAGSILLLHRLRDWRVGFLSLILALMTARQVLTLIVERDSWQLSITGQLSELPGLSVSVLAFLAVFFLERALKEREQVMVALGESELTVHALLENASQGIVVVDRGGRITIVNAMTEELFGYPRDEMLGRTIEFLVPEKLAEAHAAHRAGYFSEPHTRPMGLGLDLAGRRKDGSEFPVEISLSHMEGKGGPLAVGFITDITERRKAEEERRNLEEQLRQATKMEAVGRLAGGIAHDFNNMLTALLGFSEVVLDHVEEGHPLREGAEEVRKTCQRSALLVRQLLAVSRRQLVQPTILDLNNRIKEMETMLRGLIGEDIDLVTDLNPALSPVKADAGQMEQVLLNLVVNARDAMPTGGRLTIRTDNVDLDNTSTTRHFDLQPGPYVMMAVIDSGEGMDSELLAHIFEPFFTTKEKGKGTGLGLATVYGIIKQGGGSIWAYSEPDIGTTFKIYLPRVDKTRAPVSLEKDLGVGEEHPEVSYLSTGTVLVVEDENAVRIAVRENLKKAGFNVLEARDGAEALQVVEQHKGHVELVVTDVVMPKMSGPELVARLATSNPEVKALYISGHADTALAHHGILEEGIPFLEKPFTRAALTRKVRDVLKQRHNKD